MIACVAKTVSQSESRIAIIEAGTGTGKTASYCLASIPIALNQGKRLIISTATVALQEQILFQDLPDIKKNAGLNFSFSLARAIRIERSTASIIISESVFSVDTRR